MIVKIEDILNEIRFDWNRLKVCKCLINHSNRYNVLLAWLYRHKCNINWRMLQFSAIILTSPITFLNTCTIMTIINIIRRLQSVNMVWKRRRSMKKKQRYNIGHGQIKAISEWRMITCSYILRFFYMLTTNRSFRPVRTLCFHL